MRALLVAVSAALFLAACAGPTGSETDSGASFVLPVGAATFDSAAPSWLSKGVVHVGDTEIEVDPAPDTYVVAESGLYYVSAKMLYFTDGGPAQEVAEVGYQSLRLSPDGRYLGLIDQSQGRKDQFGTRVAAPVVIDLASGREVLRGVPEESLEGEDLADLYEEVPPYVVGFVNEGLVAFEPLSGDDLTIYPLDGSAHRPVEVDPQSLTSELDGRIQTERGFEGSLSRGARAVWSPDLYASTLSGSLSPGRDVAVVTLGGQTRARFFDSTTGKPTPFDAGAANFRLGGWVDDQTFYGFAYDAGPQPTGRIVSCVVASANCAPVSERLPVRPSPQFPEGDEF